MSKTTSDQCSLLVVDENDVVVVVDIGLVVVVSLAAKGFHLTLGKDVRENETSFIMSRLLIEVLSRLTVFAYVVMESVFSYRDNFDLWQIVQLNLNQDLWQGLCLQVVLLVLKFLLQILQVFAAQDGDECIFHHLQSGLLSSA